MTREQTRDAARASLLVDDSRDSHRNVYRLRDRRDETAAVLALYPVPRTRVSNVVPLRRPEPPAAA